MLGLVFENLSELSKDKEALCAVKYIFTHVLGLTMQPLPEKKIEITPEIQKLIDERIKARAEKDWARADEIREQLSKLGIDIHDKKIRE